MTRRGMSKLEATVGVCGLQLSLGGVMIEVRRALEPLVREEKVRSRGGQISLLLLQRSVLFCEALNV